MKQETPAHENYLFTYDKKYNLSIKSRRLEGGMEGWVEGEN